MKTLEPAGRHRRNSRHCLTERIVTTKRKLILLLAALIALLVAGRVIAKSVTNQKTQTPIETTEVAVPQNEIKTPPAAPVKPVGPTKPQVVDTNACLVAMRQVFPEETWAIGEAIMRAESGLNPNAKSATNDYGCWQIHNWELYDPLENTNAAYYKYTTYGWNPWTVYRTGAYRRFL